MLVWAVLAGVCGVDVGGTRVGSASDDVGGAGCVVGLLLMSVVSGGCGGAAFLPHR